MTGRWATHLGGACAGTVLGLVPVAGIKTFVTHIAVAWHVVWGYPLTVLTVYGRMSAVRYLRRGCRH